MKHLGGLQSTTNHAPVKKAKIGELSPSTVSGGRAMVEVSNAQQCAAGRSVSSHLPVLRQAPAVQERRAPVHQDDLRAVNGVTWTF